MTIIDTPTTHANPAQVREFIEIGGGIAFTDIDSAISWLTDETNVSFLAGNRPVIAEQLVNQLQSEKRQSSGLERLNALYLAQLVWVVLGELFSPFGPRKTVVENLRSNDDEARKAGMATALELLAKAENEFPRKMAAIETIKELADDAYLMANSTVFDWQKEIISKCQADRAMTCAAGGLEGTAKHLRNCETRLYGSGSQPQGGVTRPKSDTKAKARARGHQVAAGMASNPERKRGYIQEGAGKFNGGKK